VPAKEAPFIDFLLIGGGLASVTAAESLRVAGAAGYASTGRTGAEL